MTLRELSKAIVVPYSMWIAFSNIFRILRGDAIGRSIAVRIVGLRQLYSPPVIPALPVEKMPSFLAHADELATEVAIPHVDKTKFDTIGGGTSTDKLVKMALIIKLCKCKTAFEIGTFVGIGSVWIASNLEPGGHLWTLDLPKRNGAKGTSFAFRSDRRVAEFEGRANRAFYGHATEEMITELFGDSTAYDFSTAPMSVDFFYVDGDHSLRSVANDTLTAFTMISDTGVIIWDDYLPYHMGSHPEVVKFINWFNVEIDTVYDLDTQAAWFATKSKYSPNEIKVKCEAAIRSRWPALL